MAASGQRATSVPNPIAASFLFISIFPASLPNQQRLGW
jgi:hypothetical protein